MGVQFGLEEFDALFDDLIKVDVVGDIVPPFTS